MSKMQKKNLSQPDEKRTFDKGQVETVALGGRDLRSGDAATGLEMVYLRKTSGENPELSGTPSAIPCVGTPAYRDG